MKDDHMTAAEMRDVIGSLVENVKRLPDRPEAYDKAISSEQRATIARMAKEFFSPRTTAIG